MLSRLFAWSGDYEPLPRFRHISGRVRSKIVVQGGRTKDFSEKSRQHLSSVVEIFDAYSESWEQRQVEGNTPSPGTYRAASASLHDDLFSFGGFDGRNFFNTVHRLDTKTWSWSQVSPQNADGAPMPKFGCGMIVFRNSLVVFGGYGRPRGPTEPQSFIDYTFTTDGRGWTNEFHIYNLPKGVWSCPATTGERPPPCAGFTFTAVDDRRGVMFGGSNGEQGRMNDVYIIDLSTMNWSKLNKSGGGPWPRERSWHAACCLNYGQQFPQLLVTGGMDRQYQTLADVWILDIHRGKWRMESVSLKARAGHSLTAFSLVPGLTEVMEFGGSSERWTGSDETQPKIADTTLLQFRLVESSGQSQWELLSVVDNKKRGSRQRMIEKLCYTAESWQQQSTGEGGMTTMERQQLEGERDRAREEKREMEAKIRELEEEKVGSKKTVTREVEENIRLLKQERDRALVENIQMAVRSREAENKIKMLVIERDSAEQERNEICLQQDLLLVKKERIEEKVRVLAEERDKAITNARKLEQEIVVLNKRAMETQAQSAEEKYRLIAERHKLEDRIRVLEEERDKAVIKVREANQERETFRKGKMEADTRAVKLRAEKQKVEERARTLEKERDRARTQAEQIRQEVDKAIEAKVSTEAERDKAIEAKEIAEAERDKEMHERQVAEVKALEKEMDHRQKLTEDLQHTETEAEIGLEKQEVEPSKNTLNLEIEIQELKQHLHQQKIKSEEKIKTLEVEMEEMRVEMEQQAADTEEKVEYVKLMERKVFETERKAREGEEKARELEIDTERVRMDLQQSQARANELQQRLEEVEKSKYEKLAVQHQDQQRGPSEKSELIEVIAEKTVEVTNEKQDIDWKGYGLRLHIPSNSLPEDCSQLQLKMTVSRPKDYKLPTENGFLVSAVYSFSHNLGERKLRQPATLEMQHFVANSSYSPLCIVQSNEISPPFQFQVLEGGTFDDTEGYGHIQLDHFCSTAVYLKWYVASLIWNLKLCAVLYYIHIEKDEFQFLMYILPRLNPILKEITSKVKEEHSSFKLGTKSHFAFDDEETYIQLKIPEEAIQGWKFSNINFVKMKADDVKMQWGSDPIPFHVDVRWTGDKPIRKLEYDTVIEGAREHHIKIVFPCTNLPECETIGSATRISSTINPQVFEGFPPPKLVDLMEVVGVDVQVDWEDVGLGLGLGSTELKAIKTNCSGKTKSCMADVFTQWHDGGTSEYSWKKLAEVLCSRTVDKPGLLPDMLERIKRLS